MRIAVCCPNWIGDAVMATPTLAALRRRYPGAQLSLVARPYVAPVFEPAPFADEVLHWGGPGGLGTWDLVRWLRHPRSDIGLLLPNSFRSALLLWLSGARKRIGYARDGRAWLLTDRLRPRRERGRYVPTPMLDSYFELIRPLVSGERPIEMKLYTSASDEAAADRLMDSLGLKGPATLVVAPGAAFGMAKCWPAERFAAVARAARDELGLRTLVLCSPGELPVAERIVAASGGAALVPPEPLPGLRTVKSLVRRARAMVTNDSGLRHFAAAYDVPVVTIFGPTHVEWTETWFRKETKLRSHVPCGPCQKRLCPEGHLRCMTDITPEQVLEALAAALREFPYQTPRPDNIIR